MNREEMRDKMLDAEWDSIHIKVTLDDGSEYTGYVAAFCDEDDNDDGTFGICFDLDPQEGEPDDVKGGVYLGENEIMDIVFLDD